MIGWPCLLISLLVVGCVPDASDDIPVADPSLSWFPLEPPSLQLALGDSALLVLVARDSTGDTLGVVDLPPGHLVYESRYRPIATVSSGENDALLAVFRVHVRADSIGTDTLRFAWQTTVCTRRVGLLGPYRCYPVAWFTPLEVPLLVQ